MKIGEDVFGHQNEIFYKCFEHCASIINFTMLVDTYIECISAYKNISSFKQAMYFQSNNSDMTNVL